jgi:hypothetical protein
VYRDAHGMTFANLSDNKNAMTRTWGILVVEWLIFMVLAWYLEQVFASGSRVRRSPLFFLEGFRKKVTPPWLEWWCRVPWLCHRLQHQAFKLLSCDMLEPLC